MFFLKKGNYGEGCDDIFGFVHCFFSPTNTPFSFFIKVVFPSPKARSLLEERTGQQVRQKVTSELFFVLLFILIYCYLGYKNIY